ncbi:MAG: trigger factor [Prevotella sp.]|nr:trigger factor [Prevotella sp.]
MKISFENPDKINGLMTIVVEEEDYKKLVDDKLKEYRRKAQMPGFRPGNVPMSLIKRQYGSAVKVDEINKLLGQELYKYVKENNIAMLGEPMPSEKQVPQDLEKEGPFEFIFDIAVAPEFSLTIDGNDEVTYYDIEVTDEMIDQQVEIFASRNGHYENPEEYDAEKRDMLKGDIRQLDAEGNTLEGGITVADAVLMPQYIKVDEQKALFEGAKLGDIITFNPKKAYPESDTEVAALLKMKKEEVADLTDDFSFQITEIQRYVSSEVNQELFDTVFGEGTVNSEEEFRSKIADGLKVQLTGEADFQFFADLRAYAEAKVGDLTFPEELLKRVMKNNNKDKDDSYVEENFAGSIRELKWHLIKEQLVAAHDIKVDEEEVKLTAREMARAQFAQYGMNDVPDEYLDNYAQDLIKKEDYVNTIVDRTIDRKLTQVMKNVVKLGLKKVTFDDFRNIVKG